VILSWLLSSLLFVAFKFWRAIAAPRLVLTDKTIVLSPLPRRLKA
jgi:hypothetical protein